jgi:hypothetical protein
MKDEVEEKDFYHQKTLENKKRYKLTKIALGRLQLEFQ